MASRMSARIVILSFTWLLGSCATTLDTEREPPRYNIVVIVADDLGYTDLGSFGGEIDTPALDALARGGVRLTNFHTASSCAPTRAMLLTGTDNHVAGMGTQGGLATPLQLESRVYQSSLLPEVPTIAELLKEAGYRTYAAAKWHVGGPEAYPKRRGFDRSFVLLEGGGGHFDNTALFEWYGAAHWLEDDEPVELPEDFYSSDELTDRLMGYIQEGPAEQPFFAYFGFTAPHWPLQAPPEDIARYRGKYDAGWDELRAERMAGAIREGVVPAHATAVDFEAGMRPWSDVAAEDRAYERARMEIYSAMVDRLDQNVGRFVEYLDEAGRLDNTLFVFLADNGAEAHLMGRRANQDGWLDKNFDNSLENLGAGNSYIALQASWARATAAPFRASKSKASEGGIRVPAFVNFPGQSETGGTDNAYVRVMDLAPTFLEIAGAEIPDSMMGRSQWLSWDGGPPAYEEDDVLAFELYGRRMAQRGDWKVLLQEAPYGTGEWQLYNLASDLGEQDDLSDQYPGIRQELIDAWQQFADEVGVINPEVPVRY